MTPAADQSTAPIDALERDCRGADRAGDIGRVKDPELSAQALLEHCRQNLTGFKVPKIIQFRTEPLLKSNIVKMLRRELREPVAEAVPA